MSAQSSRDELGRLIEMFAEKDHSERIAKALMQKGRGELQELLAILLVIHVEQAVKFFQLEVDHYEQTKILNAVKKQRDFLEANITERIDD